MDELELPGDVVTEILSRLPVQQLIRCRCVCKRWGALIKSSSFVETHMALQVARGNRIMVVSHYDTAHQKNVVSCYKYDSDSLSYLRAHPDTHAQLSGSAAISGDCNGLICLSTFLEDAFMNPALRELKFLPPNPVAHRLEGRGYILAIGSGFDDAKRDYKVVRLYGFPGENKCPWEGFIYELRTNSWRNLSVVPPFLPEYNYQGTSPRAKRMTNSHLFFKGSVHWTHLKKRPLPTIVTLNMTTESFDEIQLPPKCLEVEQPAWPKLFVLANSNIACVSDVYRSEVITVWVMKEYGVTDSWTMQYSIPKPSSYLRLHLCKNDNVIFGTENGNTFCYHVPTGQLHRIHQLNDRITSLLGFEVCNPSLVSINHRLEE